MTNTEIRSRLIAWCEALESGRYEQTTDCLKDDSGFCCLGVACDLTDNSRWSKNLDGGMYEWEGGCIYLSRHLQNDYGLTSSEMSYLAALNDEGKTLPEIARWIRENILVRYME